MKTNEIYFGQLWESVAVVSAACGNAMKSASKGEMDEVLRKHKQKTNEHAESFLLFWFLEVQGEFCAAWMAP